jgi:hypothetical protein
VYYSHECSLSLVVITVIAYDLKITVFYWIVYVWGVILLDYLTIASCKSLEISIVLSMQPFLCQNVTHVPKDSSENFDLYNFFHKWTPH